LAGAIEAVKSVRQDVPGEPRFSAGPFGDESGEAGTGGNSDRVGT
jgi:hypothetical protein